MRKLKGAGAGDVSAMLKWLRAQLERGIKMQFGPKDSYFSTYEETLHGPYSYAAGFFCSMAKQISDLLDHVRTFTM